MLTYKRNSTGSHFMNYQKMHSSFLPSIFKNLSLMTTTVLALVTGTTAQVDAAVIEFDADIYAFSNPNTCTPQLPDTGGKCFVEDGVNVEAFSARLIGTTEAFYSEGGHFHSRNSYEAQHFSKSDDTVSDVGESDRLLGIYLTLTNGGLFSLNSLDYQLRRNERSIAGYTPDDTNILISPTFEPTMDVLGQFTEISLGNDINQPFQTLALSEFDNITQVYITSSGDVNFDNITLTPIPEPTSLLGLFSVVTLGLLSKTKGNSEQDRS